MMSDAVNIDAAGLLKLSNNTNPAYKTLSNYPRASIYEEMKQRDFLNRAVRDNERSKEILHLKAKQIAAAVKGD